MPSSAFAVGHVASSHRTFAGFSRFDEVLRGGIGRDRLVSTVLSELRDSETSEKMMAYINQALAAAVADARGAGLVPEGMKVRFVLREEEEDGPALPPISGGSDVHSVGSDVGVTDMAPIPPNVRRAPAKPDRSSITFSAASIP